MSGVMQKLASAVAAVFGIATLLAGVRVLSGSDPGYQVFQPLLVYNTAMGVVYLAAAVTIWRSLTGGRYAAGAIFLINLLVVAGIVVLYRGGAAVAVDSLRAMTLRTVVWLILFLTIAHIARRGMSGRQASRQ